MFEKKPGLTPAPGPELWGGGGLTGKAHPLVGHGKHHTRGLLRPITTSPREEVALSAANEAAQPGRRARAPGLCSSSHRDAAFSTTPPPSPPDPPTLRCAHAHSVGPGGGVAPGGRRDDVRQQKPLAAWEASAEAPAPPRGRCRCPGRAPQRRALQGDATGRVSRGLQVPACSAAGPTGRGSGLGPGPSWSAVCWGARRLWSRWRPRGRRRE